MDQDVQKSETVSANEIRIMVACLIYSECGPFSLLSARGLVWKYDTLLGCI